MRREKQVEAWLVGSVCGRGRGGEGRGGVVGIWRCVAGWCGAVWGGASGWFGVGRSGVRLCDAEGGVRAMRRVGCVRRDGCGRPGGLGNVLRALYGQQPARPQGLLCGCPAPHADHIRVTEVHSRRRRRECMPVLMALLSLAPLKPTSRHVAAGECLQETVRHILYARCARVRVCCMDYAVMR